MTQTNTSLIRRGVLKLAGILGASGALGNVSALAQAKDQPRKATPNPPRPAGLEHFKGEVISRSDSRYLAWFWAMTWYRIKPNRFPVMFAQPTGKDDLALLMKYAERKNLRLVPRSSGHNISNPVLQQDAITVDMSLFDQIEDINSEQKFVWAGPGVLSETLNKQLFAKGFAFPSAHTGFVTIGGYLLGGGMGWNMPKWGMGCGSVMAAEVMLADGQVVTASETENRDLYWAIRGVGPGFFGMVLRYKLQIHAVPVIVKNTYFYTLDKVEEAVAQYLKLLPQSAFRSEVLGALGKFSPPGTPEGKEQWHWVVNIMSFGATAQEAQAAADVFTHDETVAKLAVANPFKNVPLTYLDLYSQLSTDFYSQYRTSEIALFTDEPGKALATLGKLMSTKALDQRSFGFSVLGTNPTVPEPCSFTYAAPHYLSWYLIGTSNADVEKNYRLADELHAALKPLAKGYYMNEIDLTRFPQLARECFSKDKWQKLLQVRKQYDPKKRFVSYLDKAS
ncbi:FAD-binding oxidoreductase [Diaphorobacter caeni]|uniref:FAD-binding oxidoreductase n=1 Tax=Diaphorobacter caeni TaxID=2784387 RepID=UPI00188DFFBF|nr:FAD-binding oxidoreductase [Diaphorobacter caeni]MBF5004574.1 FAD-binding oxidoreductase [Diaphorobacter caeni]